MSDGCAAASLARLAAALDDADSAIAQAIEVLRFSVPPAELAGHHVDDAADLPVGIADRALLDAHEALLGRPLERTVACDACGGWTTLPLGRADVAAHWPVSAWLGPGSGAREPSYADTLAAAGSPEALLARCSVGEGATLEDIARIEGSLCGPLRSHCVECGMPLVDDVDVLALAVGALGELRAQIDREVYLLATGYGWDPATIDALPDQRRRRLAELVSAGVT
jgi:hypothetical protein